MTVSSSKSLEVTGTSYVLKQPTVSIGPDNMTAESGEIDNSSAIYLQLKGGESATTQEKKTDEKKLNKENLDLLTKTINKFMESFTADLRFSLHDRTHRLMVQMVDVKHDKVLKEFPPKEFLDMVANIRDCVGAILDKKV